MTVLKKTYRKQRNKRIDVLQKENTELKERLNIRSCQNCKHKNKSCPNDGSCKHYSKWEGYENTQLTKAKEILRSLYFIIESRIDYKNNIGIADEMWRAEQFLNSEADK